MKNSTDVSQYRDLDELATTEAGLLADLEALHSLPVPNLQLNPAAVAAPGRALNLRRWRLPVLAAAAIGALVLFLTGPSLWGGSSGQVSAETLLERTQNVAANNAASLPSISYHLVGKSEIFADNGSPGKSAGILDTTEIWYLDPLHQRSESRQTGGGLDTVFGVSRSGGDVWLYTSAAGNARVAHGPAETLDLINLSDFGASSLSDIQNELGAGSCQTAVLNGEETVAGRAAYMIHLEPSLDRCPSKAMQLTPEQRDEVVSKLSREGATNLWIDKETFVTLKTEKYGPNGSIAYRYEVSEFDTGAGVTAADAAYEPPAGATVVEVSDGAQAKQVLAGFLGPPVQKPQPGENSNKAPVPPEKVP